MIYLLTAVLLTAMFIWGGLEWYAAILLGFIAPIVGLILSFSLSFVVPRIVSTPLLRSESGVPYDFTPIVAQALVIIGSVFLAKEMRKKKGTGSMK
jgi:hypothetical protein